MLKILFRLHFIIIAFSFLHVSCASAQTPLPEEEKDYINRNEVFTQLPGWKFRCKVMVESKTVQDYGGRIEFMKKMDKLLVDASKFFQVPGINDAETTKFIFI